MTDRKKPGVAFWATVVMVVALMAYPLSVGPACWISSRMGGGECNFVSRLYAPVFSACRRCPKSIMKFARWYSEVGAEASWKWHFNYWRMTDGTENSIDFD